MKHRLLILFSFCLFAFCSEAQKRKTFTVNPGQKISDAIPNGEIYAYPDFVAGSVYLKNETVGSARLNYNALIGEIQFIDPKGDTISLAEEPAIKFISINRDTFYFDKVYVKLINTYGDVKLASRDYFEIADRQKIGAYNQVSTSGGIETYNRLSVNNSFSINIIPKELLILARYNLLYVSDEFNHFKIANKKNISDLYGKKQKRVQAYLRENVIDYNNKEEVEKLILVLNALE